MGKRETTANRKAGQRLRHLLKRERELWADGVEAIAGVDEAGMGPLAGPVVAAAVIFPPGEGIRGVFDSKQVKHEKRAELAEQIRSLALSWSVIAIEPEEIDRLNIYQAGLEAMRRALRGLDPAPECVLVDGREIPGIPWPQERWVKGDTKCHAIAAASILAKTSRDEQMARYGEEFPGYGFAEHKGYPTAAHRDAIRKLGPCSIHRRSFTLLPQPTLFD